MSDTSTYPPLPLALPHAWRALIALCIGFFMILLDQTIVAVATPVIQAQMKADYGQVIWVTSVYLLTFAVPLLIMGRLGDRFGPKNLYILGMVVFTASSLWCGLAGSIEELIIARAVQGLGASLLTPQTMSVINRAFPIERRGSALGVWGATAGLSVLSGPLLGGFITEYASWNWVFFINVPIGVLSVILAGMWVPRFKPSDRRVDALSMILSIITMTSFIYAIQEGDRVGWPWWIWALFVVSLVGLVLFIRQQDIATKRGRDPLVPLILFSRRHFAYGNIAIFTMGFTVAGMMLPFMLYLQQIHHMTPVTSALMVTPTAVISLFMSPLVGRWVDQYDPRPMAVLGFGLMALGILVQVVVMLSGVNHYWTLLSTTIMGFGNAFVWSPNSSTTLRTLPHEFAGVGSGFFNNARQLGAVTGAAIISLVVQARIDNLPMDQAAQAFGDSLIPAIILLGVGMGASWRAVEPAAD